MLGVAWSEFAHGKLPAEIHLIYGSAPLTIGSTVAFTGGYYQNAVIEAEYRAPPDSSPLPHEGMQGIDSTSVCR